MKMNKLILIFATFALSFNSKAHPVSDTVKNSRSERFFISYNVGRVNSTIYGKFVEEQKYYGSKVVNYPAWYFNASFYGQVYNIFYAKAGITLLGKGGFIDGYSRRYPAEFEIMYAAIPLRAVVKPFTVNRFSMTVEAGIDINYEFESDNERFLEGVAGPYKENALIFSTSFGGSILYRLSKRLVLQGAFQWYNDLTPFYVQQNDYTEKYDGDIRTRGKIYSIGLLIPFKD